MPNLSSEKGKVGENKFRAWLDRHDIAFDSKGKFSHSLRVLPINLCESLYVKDSLEKLISKVILK